MFRASASNVAVEADLYAVATEAGLDDALEVALSEVEGLLPGYLQLLREGPTPRKGSQERNDISDLLALQIVRTREYVHRWMFPLDAAAWTGERPISRDSMRRFLADEYLGEEPRDSEVQGAFDFANYALSRGMPDKGEILDMLLRSAGDQIAPKLADMAWAIEISNDRAFVTADRPVSLWKRDTRDLKFQGVGVGNADELRFPLGPRHLLVLRPKFPEHRSYINAARVTAVNRRFAAGCHEMVIGCPSSSEELTQFRLRPVRPALRFNTGPLLQRDASGRLVPSGQEILQTFIPYGDDAG